MPLFNQRFINISNLLLQPSFQVGLDLPEICYAICAIEEKEVTISMLTSFSRRLSQAYKQGILCRTRFSDESKFSYYINEKKKALIYKHINTHHELKNRPKDVDHLRMIASNTLKLIFSGIYSKDIFDYELVEPFNFEISPQEKVTLRPDVILQINKGKYSFLGEMDLNSESTRILNDKLIRYVFWLTREKEIAVFVVGPNFNRTAKIYNLLIRILENVNDQQEAVNIGKRFFFSYPEALQSKNFNSWAITKIGQELNENSFTNSILWKEK